MLLELQRKHIGELTLLACEMQLKGIQNKNFHIFDKNKMKPYRKKVTAQ